MGQAKRGNRLLVGESGIVEVNWYCHLQSSPSFWRRTAMRARPSRFAMTTSESLIAMSHPVRPSAVKSQTNPPNSGESDAPRRNGGEPAMTSSDVQIAPRVVHTKGVCGGRARLDGTRITVWVLESLWQQGASVEEIVESYPFLTPAHVECALDWADDHEDEIEADIREHEA